MEFIIEQEQVCCTEVLTKFALWNNIGGDFEYELGCAALEVVTHHGLGVVVDGYLKFHNHVGKLQGYLVANLLRATVNRSPEFMVTLFVSHIRPILDYCSCVWNVAYESDASLIYSVQEGGIGTLKNCRV